MPQHHYAKARNVLQALIHGVDPQSGEDVSKDSIVNRADVMRALLASVSACDALVTREAGRAWLPQVRRSELDA